MVSEGQPKITSALDTQLRRDPGKLLDVVVELAPDPGAAPATAPEMKQSFERVARPVSEAIAQHGGEVLGSVWLNRTLRVKVPAAKVAELTGMDEIAALDVPHEITPE